MKLNQIILTSLTQFGQDRLGELLGTVNLLQRDSTLQLTLKKMPSVWYYKQEWKAKTINGAEA